MRNRLSTRIENKTAHTTTFSQILPRKLSYIQLSNYFYRSMKFHAFEVELFNTLTHFFNLDALYGFRNFKMLHAFPKICSIKILLLRFHASSGMKHLIQSYPMIWELFCISDWRARASFWLFHKRKRHLSGPRRLYEWICIWQWPRRSFTPPCATSDWDCISKRIGAKLQWKIIIFLWPINLGCILIGAIC